MGSTFDYLADLRARIDQLDTEILSQLAARMAVSAEVAAAKGKTDEIYRPGRESALLQRLTSDTHGLDPKIIKGIWRQILSASIARQKPDFTIACTPQTLSTSTQLAAGHLHLEPLTSASQALDKLDRRQADLAIIGQAELAPYLSTLGPSHARFIQGAHHQPDGDIHFVLARYLPDPSGDDNSWFIQPDAAATANGFALFSQNGYQQPDGKRADDETVLVGMSATYPA